MTTHSLRLPKMMKLSKAMMLKMVMMKKPSKAKKAKKAKMRRRNQKKSSSRLSASTSTSMEDLFRRIATLSLVSTWAVNRDKQETDISVRMPTSAKEVTRPVVREQPAKLTIPDLTALNVA